jgi:dTMP kinase
MSFPRHSGFFLTFEGIDGAGKSSHLAAVRDHFEAQGQSVLMTREPGGTPLAEALRQMILRDEMDSLTEALLIFAARRDHLNKIILPALVQGLVVVCDRFTDSTFAYQGFGRDFSLEVLAQLEQWVQGELQPDLTLWFDLEPDIAAKRLLDARQPDRFESEQEEFFTRVRDGYRARSQQYPQRFLTIDADGEKHEIWKRIVAVLPASGASAIARVC